MEIYSLAILALTLYSGLFYSTGGDYEYMKVGGLNVFFSMWVVAPNMLYMLYWLYWVRIELLKEIFFMNKPRMFKVLALMDEDKFYDKYMKNDERIELPKKGRSGKYETEGD